jgi:PKD repeat protein
MRSSLLFIVLCVFYLSVSGQCTSRRYQDTIFHRVTVTTTQFGTATTQLNLPQNLSLDFYEPTGDTLTRRPLIVYAFGGAFLIGTRNQPPVPTYCTNYAQCGYAVASIDYRIGFDVLSTGSAVRAVYRAAQDLRGAVRYLCQRYPQYRIDTSAIFLTGSSAGCIAGLASTFMEPNDIPGTYIHGILTEPSDLGCYDCADNTDNGLHVPHMRGILNHWGAILDTNFIRPNARDNVPVISIHGDQDALVPYTVGYPFSYPVFPTVYGSLPMHARMDHIGLKNELHPLYGQGHEPWLLDASLLDTSFKYERPFLYSILKPLPLTISGDTTLCVNALGTYSVPQRLGSHYCWSFAGGTQTAATNNTITIRWTSTGTHLITAREMTLNDVNGDLDSFYVTVLSYPLAAFGDSVLHTSVAFSDSSVGARSWAYSFGDGGHSASQNPSHTYTGAGTFTASLVVSNGYCADTAYRTITTDTCPAVHLSYTVSHDTIYVSAEPADAVTYHWTFGDGGVDSGQAAWHVYSHSQNYLVAVSLTTAKACTGSVSQIVAYTQPATGISEVGETQYRIYPNPAHSELHVECGDCSVAIYDCLGRLVLSKYEVNNQIIDISALDRGIYNVTITAAGQPTNGRLVIQ